MSKIYLDHASTTPLDGEILEKMLPYLKEDFGNADSLHSFGRRAMSGVDFARDKVADLIQAKPNEVYFTSGGTESNNWAILSGAFSKKAEGKTHVVICAIEHHSCLHVGEVLQKEGFDVTYLPVNEGGRVEVNVYKEAITEKTGLVAVMLANNETGVIQPIEECCAIAHQKGALFFTDAVQYAPYRPIDVRKLNVDMLSFSAHKFYGPKGAGVLYIKNGVKMQPLIGGGQQERGLRGGTLNVANIVGLACAYEKTVKNLSNINEKLILLRDLFLKEISMLDNVYINGKADGLPSILNLRIERVDHTALIHNLDLQGIALSAGSACASASIKPSHVLMAMGLTKTQAKECVRISFGKNNTVEEVVFAGKCFVNTVQKLRKN